MEDTTMSTHDEEAWEKGNEVGNRLLNDIAGSVTSVMRMSLDALRSDNWEERLDNEVADMASNTAQYARLLRIYEGIDPLTSWATHWAFDYVTNPRRRRGQPAEFDAFARAILERHILERSTDVSEHTVGRVWVDNDGVTKLGLDDTNGESAVNFTGHSVNSGDTVTVSRPRRGLLDGVAVAVAVRRATDEPEDAAAGDDRIDPALTDALENSCELVDAASLFLNLRGEYRSLYRDWRQQDFPSHDLGVLRGKLDELDAARAAVLNAHAGLLEFRGRPIVLSEVAACGGGTDRLLLELLADLTRGEVSSV
jgi:hypothetical protein